MILIFCILFLNIEVLNLKTEQIQYLDNDELIIAERQALGQLNTNKIDEASGIAESLIHNDCLWTHNDNGDKANVYLINTRAEYKMKLSLEGIHNKDWEDIAVSKNLDTGRSRIYIGDIGDNKGGRKDYQIYIFDEPLDNTTDATIYNIDKINFKYAEGPRDAESMLVDPINGDIYIVTKREENVLVYKISYPYQLDKTIILRNVATLPFNMIVGGDIAQNGKEILLKSYRNVYYWKLKENEKIADAFMRSPEEVSYTQEPQGEAICWHHGGCAFYTLSEQSPFKIKQVLYKYEIK